MSVSLAQPVTRHCQVHQLDDDGVFPNNRRWPLVVYGLHAHLGGSNENSAAENGAAISAAYFENLFDQNAWPPQWRSGIFDFHHYHSTSHEVLGVFDGEAEIQFGGDSGVTISCGSGDVVIIPAGVAHRCVRKSQHFCCVGAYPEGASWDVLTAEDGDRVAAAIRVEAVAAPALDPVFGEKNSYFRQISSN